VPADDSLESRYLLLGPNQWPPEKLLPNWRNVMQEYFEQVSKLA
jgi:hypothetical protein